MAYLKITPGIGLVSDAGRALPAEAHRTPEDLKQKVWERDGHACRYCGFTAMKYQETVYTGGQEEKPGPAADPDSHATACTFCHQCFHLDRVGHMQSGALIWLPEIGQAALHHVCRAIYVARIAQGPIADSARDALEALLKRKEEARNRLGTDNPYILGTILRDFLEPKEYAGRSGRLQGFRILPLDRRIIREGELEFNQFPQMLAYWRSKEGPFGDTPPRTWGQAFFALQDKAAVAQKAG